MFPQLGAFLGEVFISCPLVSVAMFLMYVVFPDAGAVMVQECEDKIITDLLLRVSKTWSEKRQD